MYDEVVIPSRAFLLMIGRLFLCFALVAAMGAGSAGRAMCARHGLGGMTSHVMPANHADMARHAVTHHPEHGSSQHEDSDGCCCAGECSGVATMVTIPDTALVRVAVVVAEPVSVFEPLGRQTLPAEPDRLLPFANGPPAVATV
jgi:hypothetical protein